MIILGEPKSHIVGPTTIFGVQTSRPTDESGSSLFDFPSTPATFRTRQSAAATQKVKPCAETAQIIFPRLMNMGFTLLVFVLVLPHVRHGDQQPPSKRQTLCRRRSTPSATWSRTSASSHAHSKDCSASTYVGMRLVSDSLYLYPWFAGNLVLPSPYPLEQATSASVDQMQAAQSKQSERVEEPC